jgi:hypothetical protein
MVALPIWSSGSTAQPAFTPPTRGSLLLLEVDKKLKIIKAIKIKVAAERKRINENWNFG